MKDRVLSAKFLIHVTADLTALCSTLRTMRLFSQLLKQEYTMERLKSSLRKFNGRYEDLIKQYEVPLSRILMTFWSLIIYSDTLHRSYFAIIHNIIAELGLYQSTRCFLIAFPTEGNYFSRHLVPSRLGLPYALLVETYLFPPKPYDFPNFALRTSLVTLGILLLGNLQFYNIIYPKWLSLDTWLDNQSCYVVTEFFFCFYSLRMWLWWLVLIDVLWQNSQDYLPLYICTKSVFPSRCWDALLFRVCDIKFSEIIVLFDILSILW